MMMITLGAVFSPFPGPYTSSMTPLCYNVGGPQGPATPLTYDEDDSHYTTLTGTAIIEMQPGQKVSDS